MKKIFALAAVATAVIATPAAAQSNTADGKATATVVAPISIAHATTDALRFGTFAKAVGNVTITPSATGTAGGSIAQMAGGNAGSDKFTVTGDANRTFSVSANTTGNVLGTGLTFSTNAVNAATLASGTYTLYVGGELVVTAAAQPGVYTANYPVSVNYN